MYHFTPGQVDLMQAAHSIMRVNEGTLPDSPIITLERGVPSEPIALLQGQKQVFAVPTSTLPPSSWWNNIFFGGLFHRSFATTCVTQTNEGTHFLFVTYDEPPVFSSEDRCWDTNPGNVSKTCTLNWGWCHKTVYVGLTTEETFLSGINVTCY